MLSNLTKAKRINFHRVVSFAKALLGWMCYDEFQNNTAGTYSFTFSNVKIKCADNSSRLINARELVV